MSPSTPAHVSLGSWQCPDCAHILSCPRVGARCPQGCPRVVVDPSVAARHPSDPWLGRRIADRYALVDVMSGVGGPGQTYRALMGADDTPVEIRLLRRGTPPPDDPFFRLAGRVSALSHASLQRFIDYGETTEGLSYLVHQRVEWPTLLEMLQLEGPLSPKRTVSVALRVLDALRPGHLSGIDHRDLKPSNIAIGPRPGPTRVIIKSFGIMGILEQCTVGSGGGPAILGTPSYMAPERLLERRTDVRSDIYALGVMMYRMLTGRLPFTGRDNTEILARQIRSLPPPLSAHLKISPALEGVILKAMAKRPQDRFATAQEMRLALEAASAMSIPVGDLLQLDELTPADVSPMSLPSVEVPPARWARLDLHRHGLPLDGQITRMVADPELGLGEITEEEEITHVYASDTQVSEAPEMEALDRSLLHEWEEPTQLTELDDVSRWVAISESKRHAPSLHRPPTPKPLPRPGVTSSQAYRWLEACLFGVVAVSMTVVAQAL